MKNILLIMMLLPVVIGACKKDKDRNPAMSSPTGAWYVNGVAHAPDTLYQQVFTLIAEENEAYSLRIDFGERPIPASSRVDSINDRSISGGPVITMYDDFKYYRSQETSALLTSVYSAGYLTVSFPEIEMTSPNQPNLKVSGSIVYKLP